MKRIVPIVSGPHASRSDAVIWELKHGHRWPRRSRVRRHYHGWYVYDRSPATIHVASKAWRKKAKEWHRHNALGEVFPYEGGSYCNGRWRWAKFA